MQVTPLHAKTVRAKRRLTLQITASLYTVYALSKTHEYKL